MPIMSCPSCGYLIVNPSQPCPSCGAAVAGTSTASTTSLQSQTRYNNWENPSHDVTSKKLIAVIMSIAIVLLAGSGGTYP